MMMASKLAVDSIHTVESKLRMATVDAEDKHDELAALSTLAQLLADVGRNNEATEIFEKAVARGGELDENHGDHDPDDEGGDYSKEAVGLAMGWYAGLVEGNGAEGMAKAEALYTRALDMNARDPLCMGNYAVFLHRIKKDYNVRARQP